MCIEKSIGPKLIDSNGITQILNEFDNDSWTSLITFVNPCSIGNLEDDCGLLNYIDHIGIDAISLTWWLRLWGYRIARSSFDNGSIFKELCKILKTRHLELLFIGGTDLEAKLANEKFLEIEGFPQTAKVVGGYCDGKIVKNYFEELNRAQVIVLSLGSPLQEQVGHEIKMLFPKNKILFTSGAFISQSSKNLNYYPEIVNTLNLRFVYRFLKEKHTRKRLLVDYPVYFCSSLYRRVRFIWVKVRK